MMRILPFLFVSCIFLLVCCSSPKEKIPPPSIQGTSASRVIIYQLLPRLFGNKTATNKTYGTLEENGVGKFNDITEDALLALKELGITHVWYTGVIEHATLSDNTKYKIPLDDADIVQGRAGSPYAIKDYYDVDPDLAVDVPGRIKEFDALVDRTHAQGLKVIIDFVPNHVYRAYRSDAKPSGVKDFGADDDKTKAFSASNNFYYLPGQSFQVPIGYVPLGPNNSFPTKDGKFDETPAKVTGNNQFTPSPKVSDWFETAKLNYGIDIQGGNKSYFDPVPDTWLKMKDILIYWADKQVDGFRCDMAEMVPTEFWHWVIPQIKEVNPNIIFIAEIYNTSLYRDYLEKAQFDYLYDKALLYDTLRRIMKGEVSTEEISRVQEKLSGINDKMLHFMENHDEQRLASRFFGGDMWQGLPAMMISATIDNGPLMIYSGQEVGEPGVGVEGFSSDDGRTTIYDYWGVPEHQKWMNDGKFDGGKLSLEQKQLRMFYADLLSLAGNNTAITEGGYYDITSFNIQAGNMSREMHIFLRADGDERLLIITGFNKEGQTIRVQIPEDVAKKVGLVKGNIYIARDLMWRELEVGLDDNWSFELRMKPYTNLIFKIK
ncbi:MAG TPA: alpha-amylase family protein [Cyclobacteriaceae bacterium]|nr:alpha-amylase family protein [Cyclobacteriaceae bacterium]